MKLDYTIQTLEERKKYVQQIIDSTPKEQLTPYYLEILANYLIFSEKEKSKKILTDNRLVTINKRETSYEGICDKLENGENGIYNMMSDLGKNTRLVLKDPITEEDIGNIKALADLRIEIQKVQEQYNTATGARKKALLKQLIEMRQDQYVIRNDYRKTGLKTPKSSTSMSISHYDFYDDIYFDERGNPHNRGLIDFFNPKHISALLCNYSELKMAADGQFNYDLWYLLKDLEGITDRALAPFPLYLDLLIYKIDGKTNAEIQNLLLLDHNIKYSIEYISNLWRNKIPKLISTQATKEYLEWYYTYKEYGKWKKCTRCNQVKLAHNFFFSLNKGSYDGLYSLCKECRNKRSKKK